MKWQRKQKLKEHLPELESSYERWLRRNTPPEIGYAPISKVLLAELEEKLEATDSEEEKT